MKNPIVRIYCVLVVILVCPIIQGRMIWREVFTEYDMPRIEKHGMAFDEARNVTFLFSGVIYPQDRINRAYIFDGSDWTRLDFGEDAPLPRLDYGIAYDSNRDVVVIFGGGASGSDYLGDTWEWDGEHWEQKFPAYRPSDRQGQAMCFSDSLGGVIFFGGVDDTSYESQNDTWVWDGIDWLEISTSLRPDPRSVMGLVNDSSRNRLILYGGTEDGCFGLNDTWEYYNNNWHQVITSTIPPALYYHIMVYDSHRGRTVMFGGDAPGGGYNGDTWEYDGVDWEKIATGYPRPVGRGGSAACFDTVRNRVVMFGGYGDGPEDDTWEYYEAPTITPTQTITSTPTETPTPSNTPSPSPTMTPICQDTGVYLTMPSHYFTAGMPCSLTATVCNLTGNPMTGIPFFCLLDIEGFYWFYPSWSNQADWEEHDFVQGETEIQVIEEFVWPQTGSNEGQSEDGDDLYRFISAITDSRISRILGDYDIWEFGPSPRPSRLSQEWS